jgi:hypothetical protein
MSNKSKLLSGWIQLNIIVCKKYILISLVVKIVSFGNKK